MLYLHVPFCEKRCGYCAFNTFANKGELISEYVSALSKQLINSLKSKEKLNSVYFGGGTPSLLDIKHFEKLFEIFMPYTDKTTEITVEANPSSWNTEKAKALLSMGANRLSLGIQSLNDEKLAFLSRIHDAKTAITAYDESVSVGFENISVDFMYDTPFDDETFLDDELKNFLALNPTHISAYSLTIEEDTPFDKKNIQSRYDAAAANKIAARLVENGYEHYEVASFGKKRSRHNFGYWEYKQYIGAGAGAVGFDGINRLYPNKEIESYMKEPLLVTMEVLSDNDIRLERILLGLRSKVGVDLSLIGNGTMLKSLEAEGLIKIEGGKLYCLDFFVADEIAARLA